MRVANTFKVLVAVVLLSSAMAGLAMAQVDQESVSGYKGHAFWDLATNAVTWEQSSLPIYAATPVYDNTSSPPNFGFSSTDLASKFGDEVLTTAPGILDENTFTIFNSGSSAGLLQTASFKIELLDAATLTPLGAYTTGVVDFGVGGLPRGFFAFISVTNLSGAGIDLVTTDVLIRQQVATHTGPANRLGIASLDPPSVGSSPNYMYINSSTVGPEGYYTIGNPPMNANPGYLIAVTDVVPTKTMTWGKVKAGAR